MPMLEVRAISKRYRDVQALRGVSLALEDGAFAVVYGRSGSGKTTLLNMIGALDRPDEGEIFVAGRPIHALSEDEAARFRLRHIGFVFQAYNLIRALSALENAAFVLELQGAPRRERERKALFWLERVGLADKAHRRADMLSGGEQQRVAVARALAASPSIVLADEPTANLDSENATRLIRLMRALAHEAHTTFLIASHDPKVIEAASLRIRLEDGRIESIESA